MSEARLPLRFALRSLVALVPALATASACADSTAEPGPAADGGAGDDAGRSDGSKSSVDSGDDGPAKSTCEITRAYHEGCGNEGDLNCGADGFDAWCAANDSAINSEAFRRAQALCLNEDNCDGAKRRACEYEHYNDETPTPAQEALVAAYCETCDPSDIAGCTKRSTTYDPAKGIKSVDDIFIAAWEFSDEIALEMKTKCTGDPGGDTAACAKAFAGCTADVYLARLPDCPK